MGPRHQRVQHHVFLRLGQAEPQSSPVSGKAWLLVCIVRCARPTLSSAGSESGGAEEWYAEDPMKARRSL